jgi:hypothetical protein
VPSAGVIRIDHDDALVRDAIEVDVDGAGIDDREWRSGRQANERRDLPAAEDRAEESLAFAEERQRIARRRREPVSRVEARETAFVRFVLRRKMLMSPAPVAVASDPSRSPC